jgi:hypothetical protein
MKLNKHGINLDTLRHFVLIALILFTACNPKHRAMKKVFKLSEKYDLVDNFDVVFFDTIIQPEIDTVFRLLQGDTIKIDTGTLRVRLVRLNDTIYYNDTFYIEPDNFQITASCDTVFIKETVTVTRPFVDKWGLLWSTIKVKLKRWWWLLVIGLSIGLIVKYGKKYLPF